MENIRRSFRRSPRFFCVIALTLVLAVAAVAVLGTIAASAADAPSLTGVTISGNATYMKGGTLSASASFSEEYNKADYPDLQEKEIKYLWSAGSVTENGPTFDLSDHLPDLPDGEYQITVTAKADYSYTKVVSGTSIEEDGTTPTVTATVVVNIDTTAPDVSSLSALFDKTTVGGTNPSNLVVGLNVSGATDSSGDPVIAGGTLTNPTTGSSVSIPAGSTGASVSLASLGLTNGSNALDYTITMKDAAGNVSDEKSDTIGIDYDTTAPTITDCSLDETNAGLSYEHNSVKYFAGGQNFGVSVDLNEAPATYTASMGGITYTPELQPSGQQMVFGFNDPSDLDFTITVADEYGNSRTETRSFGVIDTTSPVITYTGARNISENGSVNLTLSDESTGDSCPVDWSSIAGLSTGAGYTVAGDGAGHLTVTVTDASAITDGAVLLESFTVMDHVGNEATVTLAEPIRFIAKDYYALMTTDPDYRGNIPVAGGTVSVSVDAGRPVQASHPIKVTSVTLNEQACQPSVTGFADELNFTFAAPAAAAGTKAVIAVTVVDEMGEERELATAVYYGNFEAEINPNDSEYLIEPADTVVGSDGSTYLLKDKSVALRIRSNRTLQLGAGKSRVELNGETYQVEGDFGSYKVTIPYADYCALTGTSIVKLTAIDELNGEKVVDTFNVTKAVKTDVTAPTGTGVDRSADFVELADGTVSIAMKTNAEDAESGVKSVYIDGLPATYNAGVWSAVLTRTAAADPESITAVVTDYVGNEYTTAAFSLPTVLPALKFTNTTPFTMDDGDTYAKAGDPFTVTFTTNNEVEITEFIVGGVDVTASASVAKSSSDNKAWQITGVIPSDLDMTTYDGAKLSWSVKVKDKADVEIARVVNYSNSVITFYRAFSLDKYTFASEGRKTVTDASGTVYYHNDGDSIMVCIYPKLTTEKSGITLAITHTLTDSSFIKLGTVDASEIRFLTDRWFAVFPVSETTPGPDGKMLLSYELTDLAGNSISATDYDGNLIKDTTAPVLDSASMEVSRDGGTTYSPLTAADFVKANDVIRFSLSFTERYGFDAVPVVTLKKGNTTIISGAGWTDTASGDTHTLVGEYIVPASYADEEKLSYSLSFTDVAGNPGANATIEGPTNLDPISATSAYFTDTAEELGIVKNDDELKLTFRTNHIVDIDSFKLNDNNVTPTSFTNTAAAGGNYNYTLLCAVPDGVTDDFKLINYKLVLNDLAENEKVTLSTKPSDRKITYYKPLVITDFTAVTTNATQSEADRYAKKGDYVDVTFNVNHPVEPGSTILIKTDVNGTPTVLTGTAVYTGARPTEQPESALVSTYAAKFVIDTAELPEDVTATDITSDDGLMSCEFDLIDRAGNTYTTAHNTEITKDTTAPMLKSAAGTGKGEKFGTDYSIVKSAGAAPDVTKIVRVGDKLHVEFYTTDNFSIRENSVKLWLCYPDNSSVYGGTQTFTEMGNYNNAGLNKWTAAITIPNSFSPDDMSNINCIFTFKDLAGNEYRKRLSTDDDDSSTKDLIFYRVLPSSFTRRDLNTNNRTTNTTKASATRAGDVLSLTIETSHPVFIRDFTFYATNSAGDTQVVPTTALASSNGNAADGYQKFTAKLDMADTWEDLTLFSYTATFSDVVLNNEYTQPYGTANDIYREIWYYRPLGNGDGEIPVTDPATITSSNANDGTLYAKNGDNLYVDITAGHEVMVIDPSSSICDHAINGSVTNKSGAKFPNYNTMGYGPKVRMQRVCENNETVDQTPIYCAFTVMDPAGNLYSHECDTDEAYENPNGIVIYYAPITAYTSIWSDMGHDNYARNGSELFFEYTTNHLTECGRLEILGYDALDTNEELDFVAIPINDEKLSFRTAYDTLFHTQTRINYFESIHPEGKVPYTIGLSDLAGNTLLVTRDEADDPENLFVVYDRSKSLLRLMPRLEGDGTKAGLIVYIDDLTHRRQRCSIQVTGPTGDKTVAGEDFGERANTLRFTEDGTYNVVVTANDWSRSPTQVWSFDVKVKYEKDGGYTMDILSEEPVVVLHERTAIDELFFRSQDPADRPKSVSAAINGKACSPEELIRGLGKKDVQISAVTVNDKNITYNFTVENVAEIGKYDDILGNEVFKGYK